MWRGTGMEPGALCMPGKDSNKSATFPTLSLFSTSTTPKFSKIGREKKKSFEKLTQPDSYRMNLQIHNYGHTPLKTPGYMQEGL